MADTQDKTNHKTTVEPQKPLTDEGHVIGTQAILEALTVLSDKIARTVEEGRNEGVLRPTQEAYTRYPIDQGALKQTEFGIERVDFAAEEFFKESWFQATRAVVWRLQESDEYSQVLSMLSQSKLATERAKRLLDSFAHRVSYKWLETEEGSQRNDFLS